VQPTFGSKPKKPPMVSMDQTLESEDSDEDGLSSGTDSDLEDQVDYGTEKQRKSVRSARFRSSSAAVAAALVECPTCKRRYPRRRFEKHAKACKQKQLLAVAVYNLGDELEHAFPPQPPTNLRVLSVTPVSVSLAWTPPIFDGGALITSYEVEFCKRTFDGNSRITGTWQDVVQPIQTTLDSGAEVYEADDAGVGSDNGGRATLSQHGATVTTGKKAKGDDSDDDGMVDEDDPAKGLHKAAPGSLVFAPRGLTVKGLDASTEYRHFRVRAVNRAGPSAWSGEVFAVKTKLPKPPHAPKRVKVVDRGADWILLGWDPPDFTGGGRLKGYELTYAKSRNPYAHNGDKLDVTAVEEKKVDIVGDAPGYRLEGLKGNTRYVNVQLVAINYAGMRSPPSNPIAAETMKLTREQEIVQELQILSKDAERDRLIAQEKFAGRFINPLDDKLVAESQGDVEIEVVYQRVFQRMRRSRYVEMLERELAVIRKIMGTSASASESKEGKEGSPSKPGVPALTDGSPSSPRSPGGQNNSVALPGSIPSPSSVTSGGGPASPGGNNNAGAIVPHGGKGGAAAKGGKSGGDKSKSGDDKLNMFNKVEDTGGYSAEQEHAADVRRKHYMNRIEALRDKLRVLQEDYEEVCKHRDRLMKLLYDADRRRSMLAAEWEVVRDFTGLKIDSSVMHGRRQIFDVKELRNLISVELSQLDASCTTLRGLVVESIAQVEKSRKAVMEGEEAVKERRAAMNAFEKEELRKKKINAIIKRIGIDFVSRCFYAWKELVAEDTRVKENTRRILLRWLHHKEAAAFATWKDAVVFMRKQDKKREKQLDQDVKQDRIPGLGSLVLSEAETLRMKLEREAAILHAYVQGVERDLSAIDTSLHQRKLTTQYSGLAQLDAIHDLPGMPFNVAAPLGEEILPYLNNPQSDPLLVGAIRMAEDTARGIHVGHDGTDDDGGLLNKNKVDFADSLLITLTGSDFNNAGTSMAIVPRPSTLRGKATTGEGGVGPASYMRKFPRIGGVDAIDQQIADLRYSFKGADPLAQQLISMLRQAYSYVEDKNYVAALPLLRKAELVFGYFKDAPGLLATYRLLTTILDGLKRWDLSYVYWDRCASIAKEIKHDLAYGEAMEGVARALSQRGDQEGTLHCLQRAEEVYEGRGDRHACARIYKAMVEPLRAMSRNSEADQYLERAKEIEAHGSMALAAARSKLMALHDKLVTDGAKTSRILTLESCGLLVPLLRNQAADIEKEMVTMDGLKVTLAEDLAKYTERIGQIQAELKRIAPYPLMMELESSTLTKVPRKYTVESLKEQLEYENKNLIAVLDNLHERTELVKKRYGNATSALDDVKFQLKAETGELMQRTKEALRFRSVCLNPVNIKINDVLGIATGGMNRIVSIQDMTVYMHSTADAKCIRTFTSIHTAGPKEERDKHTIGHTKLVTSVCCFAWKIFTGSIDGSVCCWDAALRSRADGRAEWESPFEWERRDLDLAEHLMRDNPELKRKKKAQQAGLIWVSIPHIGTVTSMGASAFFLVTGGSDSMVNLLDSSNGTSLRRIRVHEFGVGCISVHDRTFATSGPDRVINVWLVSWDDDDFAGTLTLSLGCSFESRDAQPSALYLVGNDVVAGDMEGRITLWNGKDGKPMVRHQVHTKGTGVYLVQNDALKVVSYGADQKLIVTDLMLGTAMQETREPHGHARVLALQFDTDVMVTVAEDRSMRLWAWKNGRFASKPREIAERPAEHIVGEDEAMNDIAIKYGLTLKFLLACNGLKDVNKVYPGMRLALYLPHDAEEDTGDGKKKTPRTASNMGSLTKGSMKILADKKKKLSLDNIEEVDDEEDDDAGSSTAPKRTPEEEAVLAKAAKGEKLSKEEEAMLLDVAAGESSVSVDDFKPRNVVEVALASRRSLEELSIKGTHRRRGVRLGPKAVDKLIAPTAGGTSGPGSLTDTSGRPSAYGPGSVRSAVSAPSGGSLASGRNSIVLDTDSLIEHARQEHGATSTGDSGEISIIRNAGSMQAALATGASVVSKTLGGLRRIQARGGPDANIVRLKRKVVAMKTAAAATVGVAKVGASGTELKRQVSPGFSAALQASAHGDAIDKAMGADDDF
jgi:Fibronectin type III domain